MSESETTLEAVANLRAAVEISSADANHWWRKTQPAGALLNNLMILFILVPIAMVLKNFYFLSLVVFSLMIPYGLLVRHLSVCAVRNHLAGHPDVIEDFRDAGIIRTREKPATLR